MIHHSLTNEQAIELLIERVQEPATIFLEGELGSGKTFFVSSYLHFLGYQENVNSPTYSMLETYLVNDKVIAHLDLYRLKSSSELPAIGFDYIHPPPRQTYIEWASLYSQHLPEPQFILTFTLEPRQITMQIC